MGTCGWSFDDWKGPFYPPGADDQLVYYASQFSAVEVDSTWYRIPSRSTVESWLKRGPEGFVFCPKFPGQITHDNLLADSEDITDAFLRTISGLGDRLGPLVVQLSPRFPSDQLPLLRTFLGALPVTMRFAVEFRHKSWLDEPAALDLLRELRMGVVVADHPWYPRFEVATCDFIYLRMLGKRDVYPDYSEVRRQRNHDLAHWVHVLGRQSERVKRGYVFVNNQFEGHSPDTVRRLVDILGEDVVPAAGRAPQDEPPRLFE